MNLFQYNPRYTNSHFLHLRLLNFLKSRSGYSTTLGLGYVEIDELFRLAEEISISREAVGDSISRLALFGLVEFDNQSNVGLETANFARITNSGMYYLATLVEKFQYLDAMWMDTPIKNLSTVEELLKYVVEIRVAKSDIELDERFVRTAYFLGYLEDQETEEFANSPELRESPFTKDRFMFRIRKSFEEQKAYVLTQRKEASQAQASQPLKVENPPESEDTQQLNISSGSDPE